MRTLLSVVTPTFNESDNIDELVGRVAAEMARHSEYDYEHIVIDNASTDGTQDRLRTLAAGDSHIRIIFNSRNFGHIRSPYHAILQARG